eukprot:Awhi_evm1s8502
MALSSFHLLIILLVWSFYPERSQAQQQNQTLDNLTTYRYTVAYTDGIFRSYEKILAATEKIAKVILPQDFVLDINFKDNKGNEAIAENNLKEAFTTDRSVAVVGPVFSNVVFAASTVGTWHSYPLVTIGTNNAFTSKKSFPTLIRMNVPEFQHVYVHAAVLRKLNFTRVGLLVESIGVGLVNEFQRLENVYGLEVPESYLFDFEIRRGNDYTLTRVRRNLEKMKNSKLRIFGIAFAFGGHIDKY